MPMMMIVMMMVQVMWDDVFGEPEGVRSADCAWQCSHKCFHGTRFVSLFVLFILCLFDYVLTMIGRSCCYLSLTTIFAPCLAFCSGWFLSSFQNLSGISIFKPIIYFVSAINFACLAFQV